MFELENTVADHFKEFVGDDPQSSQPEKFADILYAMAEGNYKLKETMTDDEITEVVVLVGNGWKWEDAIRAVLDERPF